MPYGREGCTNEKFIWKIHGETEYITESPSVVPDKGQKVNIVFNRPVADNFFDHVFPSVVGARAKVIDKYLTDQRATYYVIYTESKD